MLPSVRTSILKYITLPHKVFSYQKNRELEDYGLILKNPSSRWDNPALASLKTGTETLRFAVDLRGPNSQTVPIQSTMQYIESKCQDFQGD